MTKEQAIALGKTEFWKDLSHRDIAEFQLVERRLCMPFSVFHEAVEKAIGRPVSTHEFVDPTRLLAELRGEMPPRTLEEIIALIPEAKRIVITV